jgi:hypothetical protein
MSNIYKNAFFDPSDTSNTVVYATDSLTRAIIQNIQVTNESGSKVVRAYVFDASNSNTAVQVAYADITGPTICNLCNLAKGPIILEESDTLVLSSSDTSGVSATVSILEVNRGLIQQ